jgi:hypothetical protein
MSPKLVSALSTKRSRSAERLGAPRAEGIVHGSPLRLRRWPRAAGAQAGGQEQQVIDSCLGFSWAFCLGTQWVGARTEFSLVVLEGSSRWPEAGADGLRQQIKPPLVSLSSA